MPESILTSVFFSRPFVFVLVAATTTLSVALAAPAGGQKDEDLYLEGLEDQEEQEQEEQGWASQDLAYLQLLTDPQGSQLEGTTLKYLNSLF